VNEQPAGAPSGGYQQLAQVKVGLREAGDILANPDAAGRTPIVIVVARPNRIEVPGLLAATVAAGTGIVGLLLWENPLVFSLCLAAAICIAAITVLRSFFVQVPEGANGLLLRKSAHAGTVGPGSHIIPPWIAVSHLVTRREIPYDAPIVEAPTRDNVRAWVDSLITIQIVEPYRFVYNITAYDFDAVLAASCQDELRRMVRNMTWDQIGDLTRGESSGLCASLSEDVATYGVTVSKVTITYARPPTDFLLSEEARQLAVLQRAEHAERHTLAQRRQSDEDELARQRSLARVGREREELEIRIQEAEAQGRVADIQTEATIHRLAKLEEALARFPNAAKYDFEGAQLDAVRALATNSRAVVQMGNASDVGRAFVVRDILHGAADEADTPRNDATAMRDAQAMASSQPSGDSN
jgi:regulator of protease activity HflC (stomatin/prohibitin superfamily)